MNTEGTLAIALGAALFTFGFVSGWALDGVIGAITYSGMCMGGLSMGLYPLVYIPNIISGDSRGQGLIDHAMEFMIGGYPIVAMFFLPHVLNN